MQENRWMIETIKFSLRNRAADKLREGRTRKDRQPAFVSASFAPTYIQYTCSKNQPRDNVSHKKRTNWFCLQCQELKINDLFIKKLMIWLLKEKNSRRNGVYKEFTHKIWILFQSLFLYIRQKESKVKQRYNHYFHIP